MVFYSERNHDSSQNYEVLLSESVVFPVEKSTICHHFVLDSGLLFLNLHFDSYLKLSLRLTFALHSSTMISLPLSLTLPLFLTATLRPPPPSEDKLWLGPDIPSNLLSQHRVKRARVLQRKPLYAAAAVPWETWHTTAQGCHAGNHLKKKIPVLI